METSCSGRVDDENAGGEGVHCLHELDAESDVCCWCGDVFLCRRGKEHGPNLHASLLATLEKARDDLAFRVADLEHRLAGKLGPGIVQYDLRSPDLVLTLDKFLDAEAVVKLTPLQLERIRIGKLWLRAQQERRANVGVKPMSGSEQP